MLRHQRKTQILMFSELVQHFIFLGLKMWATILVGNQLTFLQPKGYFKFF